MRQAEVGIIEACTEGYDMCQKVYQLTNGYTCTNNQIYLNEYLMQDQLIISLVSFQNEPRVTRTYQVELQ